MGATFDGELNLNLATNDDAESLGVNLRSHLTFCSPLFDKLKSKTV